MFSEPVENLVLSAEDFENNIFRVQIKDAESNRFEVPVERNFHTEGDWDTGISTKMTVSAANVEISRDSSKIFDMSFAPLVFEDQYISFGIHLDPSWDVYGFGESEKRNLKIDRNRYKQGIFARDVGTYPTNNGYGHHPFFMVVDESGKAHGIFFNNANAMEVEVTETGVVFRTIGGVIDIFILAGDTPQAVLKQYTHGTGRPILPPYWSLGFHLCRWVSFHKKIKDSRRKFIQDVPNSSSINLLWVIPP